MDRLLAAFLQDGYFWKRWHPDPYIASPSTSPACLDSALFVTDVTYPDGSILSRGRSFNKTWRLKNTGTCSWNGYTLAFITGDQMGGPPSVSAPTAAPGQTVDITVSLVAPSSSATGYWQIKDDQGLNVDGGSVRVSIDVVAPTTGAHITAFSADPPSPSTAASVHLVARVRYFLEFRSMRFVVGNDKLEMTNFRQVGDQVEISTDWNTSSLARGTYALAVEVATKSDPSWSNVERQVINYTLTGSPSSSGHAPEAPILKSPHNWYLKDAAGAAAPVQMCVYPASDPDGNPVQYLFEVYFPQGSTSQYRSSGWVSSTCWESTFEPNVYSWRAKAGDGTNYSDFSQETWNFSTSAVS